MSEIDEAYAFMKEAEKKLNKFPVGTSLFCLVSLLNKLTANLKDLEIFPEMLMKDIKDLHIISKRTLHRNFNQQKGESHERD